MRSPLVLAAALLLAVACAWAALSSLDDISIDIDCEEQT